MSTVNLPVALKSAQQSLSAQCQLSSWDVRGKGNFTTVVVRFTADTTTSVEQPPAREVNFRRKSPSELRRDQQRAVARQQHTRQRRGTDRSSGCDTHNRQEAVSMADPEPVSIYSPHRLLDNATKDQDRQVGDCDQNTQLCGTDLPEPTDTSTFTQSENVEECQAIPEEWENDRGDHDASGAGIMEADDCDDSFHSPTVIPQSALDKPSIMKRYHRRRTTR